ncbi:MAG: purine-nucleoside phosphorylase [Bacteroidota bacterium]
MAPPADSPEHRFSGFAGSPPGKAVAASAAFLRSRVGSLRRTGIILGSGLGDFADGMDDITAFPVGDIPGYVPQTVPGHRGRLLFGKVGGRPVLAFQGRIHFYECGNLEQVLHPVHLAAAMGVSTLIITNAAGGIHPSLGPGDLMMIRDQINLTGERLPPGCGTPRGIGPYAENLWHLGSSTALSLGIPLADGIYAGVKGPSYETASEIRMLAFLGADAVGMSTVMEAALAASYGMEVAGISCITNMATGLSSRPLSHDEVTQVGQSVRGRFAAFLQALITRLENS